jgi:glycosyltransferase involved in cell wall biosynthesis
LPKLVQISFSPLLDDPRVRRNADGLAARGWEVAGLGLSGGKSPPPAWPIYGYTRPVPPPAETSTPVSEPEPAGPEPKRGPLKRLRRVVWFTVAAFIGVVPWITARLLRLFNPSLSAMLDRLAHVIWTDIGWPVRMVRLIRLLLTEKPKPRAAKAEKVVEDAATLLQRRQPIQELIALGETIGPADIWVANDWTALPVAQALRDKFGGRVVYDSHEFALEEYAQNPLWRATERPIAASIEGGHIRDAGVVTAVSASIAEALRDEYHLNVPCEAIFNAPARYKGALVERTLADLEQQVRVLYHGIVARGRGLEASIRSVPRWPDNYQLTIRGPESEKGLTDELRALAKKCGVADRVIFAPPVEMVELVASARHYDVGLFALPSHSAQNRFALPNKFFEYMAAGLALVVSDLPEMAHIVRLTGCGALIRGAEEGAITKTICALTPQSILTMKQASRQAAQTYNSEVEAAKLDMLYRSLLVT